MTTYATVVSTTNYQSDDGAWRCRVYCSDGWSAGDNRPDAGSCSSYVAEQSANCTSRVVPEPPAPAPTTTQPDPTHVDPTAPNTTTDHIFHTPEATPSLRVLTQPVQAVGGAPVWVVAIGGLLLARKFKLI